MKILLKNFLATMQARVVISSMQVDTDLLYRRIDNQSSIPYSSLYLSDFLSFHTLNYKAFHHRFYSNP